MDIELNNCHYPMCFNSENPMTNSGDVRKIMCLLKNIKRNEIHEISVDMGGKILVVAIR